MQTDSAVLYVKLKQALLALHTVLQPEKVAFEAST